MFCSQCGSKNEDGAVFCTQCGTTLKPGAAAPQPPQPAPQPALQPAPQYVQPAPVYPTNTTTVIYPAAPAAAAPAVTGGPAPSSHIFLAILSTFCCGCFPVGLISLIFAMITMSRISSGQIQTARGSSRMAAIWGWIAIILGLLMYIAWAIWIFFMGGLAVLKQMQQQ